jgi:hypothetical protein
MVRWTADDALANLIRRYYAGEAGLWAEIRQQIDDELRRRRLDHSYYHIRLHGRGDGGYDVQLDDAAGYANTP